MTWEEYTNLFYNIGMEKYYYDNSSIHTDGHKQKKKYYDTLYYRKQKWEKEIITEALKKVDKSFFLEYNESK